MKRFYRLVQTKIRLSYLLILGGFFGALAAAAQPGQAPDLAVLSGRIIALDPGHGGTADTDHFRIGPSGEREEWINLRVGLLLRDLLEAQGATVILTRESDLHVELADRAKLAMEAGAELFLSIHHNATADRRANFPIVYYHGSALENPASVRLAQYLGEAFADSLFLGRWRVQEGAGSFSVADTALLAFSSISYRGIPLSIVSDYTIFPSRGAMVLRGTYGIPAIIAEASFFSNAEEEARLKQAEYNQAEAQAYLWGITRFLSAGPPEPVLEKQAPLQIAPFRVFEQAERMKPEALDWQDNYQRALAILQSIDPLGPDGLRQLMWGELNTVGAGQAAAPPLSAANLAALDTAWGLFELSAKAFPDSYLARASHAGRARILQLQGKPEAAAAELRRLSAFYPLPSGG